MRPIRVLCVLLLFGLICPGMAVADSIVLDGSFEVNRTTRPFLSLGSGWNLGAWHVDSGSVDFIHSYWPAVDGTESLELNGWSRGSIYQDLHTVAGQQYRVSFFISGNPDAAGVKPLQFWWNGTLVGANLASDLNTWQNFHYVQFIFPDMVAAGATTRIEFVSGIENAWGPVIDNVTVEPVPEPASLLLFGSGASCLLPLLRRKNRAAARSRMVD
jgi:Protein of unknown function (DUF642)/PEP-CTERM motif